MQERKTILIILDGWGEGPKDESNAIYQAKTPFVDSLYSQHPTCWLNTSGEDVGLPQGQMGNSEVGHLNIGAGRIVHQELVRINNSIHSKQLDHNKTLLSAFEYANTNNSAVHFIGLVSDGGVHSHMNHLHYLCKIAYDNNVTNTFVHAFTDGRDTDPHSGKEFIKTTLEKIKPFKTKVASVTGRYYAMDRDKRWERIKIAYDALVYGTGSYTTDLLSAIEESYQKDVSDEFIKPIISIDSEGNPITKIQPNDVVICFNFRTDRCRQIVSALSQTNFSDQNMQTLPLHLVTMTNYDDTFKGVEVIFENDNLVNTIGEVLQNNNKKQIRISETEKYPHVTFFFSGGRETKFENEKRILINSPKVATYDLQPEMSAHEVTEKICVEIESQTADFICLNFANADMVGHTGNFNAIVKAVETVDTCTEKVVNLALTKGYTCLITADHGNADKVKNRDGSPNTAHSTYKVPCFLVGKDLDVQLQDGILADIAPTLLTLMDIEIPEEMNGKNLILSQKTVEN